MINTLIKKYRNILKYLKINELEGYFDDDFFSIIQLEIFSFGLTLLNVVEGL